MKKTLKKKKPELDSIFQNEFYKSIETIIDNDGIALKFIDPFNNNYLRNHHTIDGKIFINLTWESITPIQKNKILKLFKEFEKITLELQKIS